MDDSYSNPKDYFFALLPDGVKTFAKWIDLFNAKKHSPIHQAIQATSRRFSMLERLQDELSAWVTHPSTIDLFEKFSHGEAPDEEVHLHFIKTTGFFFQDETNTPWSAREALDEFFRQLRAAIVKGSDGLVFVAEQNSITHRQIGQMQEQMSQLSRTLTSTVKNSDLPLASKEASSRLHGALDSVKALIESNSLDSALLLLDNWEHSLRNESDSDQELMFRFHSGRGSIFNRKGRYDDALREFSDAYRFAPTNPIAIENRAYASILEKKPEVALIQAEQALLIEPGRETALSVRAIALYELGRGDETDDLWHSIDLTKEGLLITLANLRATVNPESVVEKLDHLASSQQLSPSLRVVSGVNPLV